MSLTATLCSDAPCERPQAAGEEALRWRTQDAHGDGEQRESSIIKAQTRPRDEHEGGRGGRGGGVASEGGRDSIKQHKGGGSEYQ